MRRLTDKFCQSGEEGVSGVIVVLTTLVLVGVGAVAVDVGQIYSERAQLQNAADAGALAVANSCAEGSCDTSLAAPLANQNSMDGKSTVQLVDTTSTPNQVLVVTSTKNGVDDGPSLSKLFASALSDASAVTVGATATATWGGPLVGPASLPLTFAPCQFDFSGKTAAIFNKGKGVNCAGDESASGKVIPGGFEWIDTIDGECAAIVHPPKSTNSEPLKPYVTTDTGANMDKDCHGKKGEGMEDFVGHEVLIPVFSGAVGNGADGIYYIQGFAAFHLDGFVFPGNCAGTYSLIASKCGGSENGIQGHFVKFVTDPALYTGGGYTEGGVTLPPHLVK
jgi:Flp pilus assembly protein TadG